MHQVLSERGLTLIKSFEGLRLSSYRDSGGIWTIGYGHTGDVGAGKTISELTALTLLQADVMDCEALLHKIVEVPLNQGQFDALVSFLFNVGFPFDIVGLVERRTLSRGGRAIPSVDVCRWSASARAAETSQGRAAFVLIGNATRSLNASRQSGTTIRHAASPERPAPPASRCRHGKWRTNPLTVPAAAGKNARRATECGRSCPATA